MIVVERLIDVGERLRLHALARIHHQERALAGCQAAVDFVGKVHVAGRVDQVEDVVLAVLGAITQPDRLGFDGDAALALDIHGIEHLLAADHLPFGEAAGELDQPIRKGGLAMVDMGDDGKIADIVDGHGGHGPHVATRGRGGKCMVRRRAPRGLDLDRKPCRPNPSRRHLSAAAARYCVCGCSSSFCTRQLAVSAA